MAIIANPIYDVVFKYMMEDERVAKMLLSALLQKEVVALTMRQNEYTDMQQSRISLFRIDFSATVRNADGAENIILIELQKTWLTTETLRFRQYLGIQYLDKKNVPAKEVNPKGFGVPIVSIYILGHKVGDLTEPVVYVRRHFLDSESHPITQGVPDPFIESLTHDSIIVQIPYLKGRMRNRLERLLNVFDQDYCLKEDEHLLEIDEEQLTGDEHIIIARLSKAAAAPSVRRGMEVEDEILSEIEDRDTTIMMKDKEIEMKSQEIEMKSQEIEMKSQEIEMKSQEIEMKSQEIEMKSQEIEMKSQEIEIKDKEIEKNRQEIERQSQILRSMVRILSAQGISIQEIARQLCISEQEVVNLLE